jgi:hypothetical protein
LRNRDEIKRRDAIQRIHSWFLSFRPSVVLHAVVVEETMANEEKKGKMEINEGRRTGLQWPFH